MLKTSTKISLKFTAFTIIMLTIFGIIINTIFFLSWYQKAEKDIRITAKNIEERSSQMGQMMSKLVEQRFNKHFVFTKNSEEARAIKENIEFKNIAKLQDYYVLFFVTKDNLHVMNVTPQVEGQYDLIELMFKLTVIFSLLSYLISLLFVKTSLKKLNKLVEYTQNINLDKLEKINMSGVENDEIKIVADSLDKSLSKISEQTNALKDFVSNVSHEFKTPLMVINSDVDYSIKSKKYEEGLISIKNTAKNLNDLIEHLTLITRIEDKDSIKMKSENCSQILENILEQTSKNYENKNITITNNIKENIYWDIHKVSFEMIVKNILENAFKYTSEKGTIEISLDENQLYIKDNGLGISSDNIEKIWERFWKEDSSRTENKSYGLGLFLVQKLVKKHGWTISVKSEKGLGSIFTIKK